MSDVDLMVVGDVSFEEVVTTLGPVQERLGREVNPTVYSEKEFNSKLTAGRHFLMTVMKHEKVFLIGNEHDIRGLGQ